MERWSKKGGNVKEWEGRGNIKEKTEVKGGQISAKGGTNKAKRGP